VQAAIRPPSSAEAANATIDHKWRTRRCSTRVRTRKRFFLPGQRDFAEGAEAKQKAKVAKRYRGIATENGAPMHFQCSRPILSGIDPAEI
jgi:hypothetical protein